MGEALIAKDYHTRFRFFYPVPTNSMKWADVAMKEFMAGSKIQMLYTDGAIEFKNLYHHVPDILVHRTSPNSDPQANGWIESEVRNFKEGTSAAILASGLPAVHGRGLADTTTFA